MVAYQYEALKITNRTKEAGIINAASEREARERLRDQDLIPTRIRVITADTSGKALQVGLVKGLFQKITGIGLKEKIAFSRNLGMMIKSGIPLSEALLYLENYAKNEALKRVLSRIRGDILSGSSFSQALAQHKKVFNDVYVNVAQAGEASGELVVSMARLTNLLTKAQKLQMKIITASVYPLIVLLIVAVVLSIMTFVVLPTFQEIYLRMGVELPWITQLLMSASNYLRDYGYLLFPCLVLCGFAFFQYFRTAGGRRVLDGYAVRLPVVGELVRLINNGHFISTFSVAFGAGLPITEALSLGIQTVQHTQMKEALSQVNIKIQTGQRLALALAETGYIPDIVLLMISAGEESGELDTMLQNSYEYVEDEINHRIDILTAMMEPLMLIILGVIVGFLALAIYMPMFRLYESL